MKANPERMVDDLGEHAADRACRAMRDVVLLGETPKQRANIAIIALAGMLGCAAGFVGDAMKELAPDVEINADTAVRLTLSHLLSMTEDGASDLREMHK